MKEIDTIREALEKGRDALNGTEINIQNYNEADVSALNEASTTAWWAIRDALAALSTIDPGAIRPSEGTEKLCHQIYDVLPISPALKLLDDGKLYALITAHDEAIRREILGQICPNHDHPYAPCPDGCECKNSAELVAILGTEPAREEKK